MNLLNLFSLAIEIAEQFNLLPLVTAIQIMILFADIMSRGGGRSVTACNCYLLLDHNFDC